MKITLAFESAVAGGSISLLRGLDELDFWIGSSDVSKAEDLLINSDALLSRNDLSRRDIRLVVVSAGPGSFTGIRIGVATALGLTKGLGVSMASVSALEAIAAATEDENIIVAVPMGRNSVCVQEFSQARATHEPHTVGMDRFVETVRQSLQKKYIVHEKLYTTDMRLGHVTNFGSNVAKAVGLFAVKNPGISVAPLFLSKVSQ